MKFAIISDIHGNYPALQLVIEDAVDHGATGFLLVGDYCISVPWPKEVVEAIGVLDNAYIIRGNEESYLNVPNGMDAQFEISRWCRRTLSEEQRKWLNGFAGSDRFTVRECRHTYGTQFRGIYRKN